MSIISDGTHKTPHYVEKGVPFLSVQNISKGYFDLSKIKYITREEHETLIKRVKPEKNDILMCRIGTLGKAIKCTLDFEFSIFVSLGLLRPIDPTTSDYIVFVLNTPLVEKWIQDNKVGGGTHTYKINLVDLPNILLPVPPRNEQERIFAKLSELDCYIREYEQSENNLLQLNLNFPEQLKKSILQEAVQGKLVPQDPSDEPASVLLERIREEKEHLVKEGKIKKDKNESVIFRRDNSYYEKSNGVERCIDKEIPFEIPDNWCWTRIKNIINVVSARRVHQSDWKSEGIPFYRAREIGKLSESDFVHNELFISKELYSEFSKSGVPVEGDLMITAVGTLGKVYIVKKNDQFYYKDASVICFENYGKLNSQYLKIVIQSPFFSELIKKKTAGTTVNTITISNANEYLIPLPPLSEQRRIIQRMEKLNQWCKSL